jgi:regulator of cell morphogenesis and NO signaling
MTITRETTVAEIARTEPGTIKVFQQHNMDFCCGGKIPLAQGVRAVRGGRTRAARRAARGATRTPDAERDWTEAPLTELITYIQQRFHTPLREELPRLSAMLAKRREPARRALPRHPDAHCRPPLKGCARNCCRTWRRKTRCCSRRSWHSSARRTRLRAPPGSQQPIHVMEGEHDAAGAALARIRQLTGGHVPPPDACPTFQRAVFRARAARA